MPSSRLVPGRYPAPGVSQVADHIRERRGARGLTQLDGTLLHVPPVAAGWNSLLGGVRTKGNLPGDIRELIILRVAAINYAAYEWIHHERVGRDCGLTTAQLFLIRDTSTLPPKTPGGKLNALQASALAFADESTKNVKVAPATTLSLKNELRRWVDESGKGQDDKEKEEMADDLLVEAAAVTSVYNMVSRFLVSLDIAGMSDEAVPWPADREAHKIPMPEEIDKYLHVVTLQTNPSAPWIILCNSLLTDHTMWDHLLPYLLSPQSSPSTTYNVLLHDQRGHGKSSIPTNTPCTVPQQARDIAAILSYFNIPSVHSVIGVSQGGATALSFGAQFPDRTKSVVACDTGPRTPKGNKEAWQQRMALAREQGMDKLANITAARWFSEGSACYPGTQDAGIDKVNAGRRYTRTELIMNMITATTLDGFAAGAGALMEYDLIDPAPVGGKERGLLESTVKTLLVAGSLDGGGHVAKGMRALQETWNGKLGEESIGLKVIEGAGHLPMVDETEKFWEIIRPFLGSVA